MSRGRSFEIALGLLAAIALVAATGTTAAISPGTAILAPSAALRAVASKVASGMDPSFATKVRIAAPPAGAVPAKDRTRFAGALWVYVDALETDPDLGAVQGEWEANLVGGAIRDLAAARGLPRIIGVSVQPIRPGGAATVIGAGGHLIDRSTPNAIMGWTAPGLTSTIEANAATAGVTLNSVTIQRPAGFAITVDITASARSVAAAVRAIQAVVGNQNRYEGVLTVVRDRSGAVFYAAEHSTRARSGGFWADPSLGYPGPGTSFAPMPIWGAPVLPLSKPVSAPEWRGVVADWDSNGSFAEPHSCAATVVARSHAVTAADPKGAAFVRALNAYEKAVCPAAGNGRNIRLGFTDRRVTATAGPPVPWLSTSSCWFYRAAKPRRSVVGRVVCFTGGRVSQIAPTLPLSDGALDT